MPFEKVRQFSVFCVSLAIYDGLPSVNSLLSSPSFTPVILFMVLPCGIDMPMWKELENQPEANPSVFSAASYNFAHHCSQPYVS